MQTAGFGRRGAPAGGMSTPAPVTFGGRATAFAPAMTAEEAEIARRRAAFLASERARPSGMGESHDAQDAATIAPSVRTIYVREKSMGVAYLIWFLLGSMGVHRFYLGRMTSAAIQLGVWAFSIVLMLSGSPLAVVTMLVTFVWVIGDAFLIPGMVRATNGVMKPAQVAHTFA